PGSGSLPCAILSRYPRFPSPARERLTSAACVIWPSGNPLLEPALFRPQPSRSLSEYSPVLPHCPWVSLGLGLFGHGPRARRALSPPQLVAALQERRQIFRRLWVKQISCHSADTFSSPRNKNLRIPRADLI